MIFAVGVLITGSIWAKGSWGHWWVWNEPTLVSFLIVFLLYATYFPFRYAIEDRRAPGSLRLGLRGHRWRLRAAQLHRRADSPRASFIRGSSPPQKVVCQTRCSSPSSFALAAMVLLWITLVKFELTAKSARAS